jgi:dTDP-4-amino-4,6-dideoxygalactose transaminase
MTKPIPVTSPLLPPLDDFIPYLRSIWSSSRLTNSGPFHQQLENELAEYLGVKHLSLFANGTLALVTALQALRITGEVITTPYSFVATAHSLLWNGLKPVFVDIDPHTCNINPERVEEAITPATTAILPVHCYGFPCDVDKIGRIADVYGLKVIYDAAHAFAVEHNSSSILQHGDLSILSFHATKVFNTFEGGAIICPDEKIKQRIDYFKNFGFVNETTVVAPGINGKMNEIEAAFGLLQLKHIDQALQARAQCYERYSLELSNVPGIKLFKPPAGIKWNYSYCPLLVEKNYPLSRDGLYEELRKADILSRRYFYPLITDFPMYRGLESAHPEKLPNARSIAERVLCLPIYPGLDVSDQSEIISIVKKNAIS